jgi:hypothetical protein
MDWYEHIFQAAKTKALDCFQNDGDVFSLGLPVLVQLDRRVFSVPQARKALDTVVKSVENIDALNWVGSIVQDPFNSVANPD